jgi:hypothetical protein
VAESPYLSRIDETGSVHWEIDRESLKSDPGLADVAREKARAVQRRLDRVLQDATDADIRAAAAVQQDIGTDRKSFNPSPYGGGDKADAKRAADMLSRMGNLDKAELTRLDSIMTANRDSPEFSRTLLNQLDHGGKHGPEALLGYSESLSRYAHGDHGNKNTDLYKDLHTSLSHTFATATKDNGMGEKWEDELLKLAREDGGPRGSAPHNTTFPVLTDLMGAGGRFEEDFLHEVGDELIAYEKDSGKSGTELWGTDFESAGGYQTDPMGGFLNALSRNPDAATTFLDPDATENLKYLNEDRTWPPDRDDAVQEPSRQAFGYALEAAATGQEPRGPVSIPPVTSRDEELRAAQERIFDETVRHYGSTPGEQSCVPAGMQRSMGDMLAHHAPAVHDVLGKNPDTAAEKDEQDNLTRVIRGAAEDGEAFKVIHTSQTAQIALNMGDFGHDEYTKANPAAEGTVQQAGKVLGLLDGVRADVIADMRNSEKDDRQSEIEWNAKMSQHGIGSIVSFVPVVGDIIDREVDILATKYAEGAGKELDDIDSKKREELAEHYNAGSNLLQEMIARNAIIAGVPAEELDATGGGIEDLQSAARTSYTDGKGLAQEAMGEEGQ